MKAKDVLHLYLGCEALVTEIPDGLAVTDEPKTVLIDGTVIDCSGMMYSSIKLILRPLSSMTEGELKEWAIIVGAPKEEITQTYLTSAHKSFIKAVEKRGVNAFVVDEEQSGLMFKITFFLLSKGFDIFNLHESGECLYESDLTK